MNQEVLEVVANTNNDGSFSFEVDYNENYFIVGVKTATSKRNAQLNPMINQAI